MILIKKIVILFLLIFLIPISAWPQSSPDKANHLSPSQLLLLKNDSEGLNKIRDTGGLSTRLGIPKITVQDINKANSRNINVDLFEVEISKLPTSMNGAEELLNHVRINLADFLKSDSVTFTHKTTKDGVLWNNKGPASVGTVHVFKLKAGWTSYIPKVHEQAGVIVSQSDKYQWIFSTVMMHRPCPNGQDGTVCSTDNPQIYQVPLYPHNRHPVSGHRQFGIKSNGSGGYIFYTRGLDRSDLDPTDFIGLLAGPDGAEDKVYEQGAEVWKHLQTKLANYINENGGSAKVQPPKIKRVPWAARNSLNLNSRSPSSINFHAQSQEILTSNISELSKQSNRGNVSFSDLELISTFVEGANEVKSCKYNAESGKAELATLKLNPTSNDNHTRIQYLLNNGLSSALLPVEINLMEASLKNDLAGEKTQLVCQNLAFYASILQCLSEENTTAKCTAPQVKANEILVFEETIGRRSLFVQQRPFYHEQFQKLQKNDLNVSKIAMLSQISSASSRAIEKFENWNKNLSLLKQLVKNEEVFFSELKLKADVYYELQRKISNLETVKFTSKNDKDKAKEFNTKYGLEARVKLIQENYAPLENSISDYLKASTDEAALDKQKNEYPENRKYNPFFVKWLNSEIGFGVDLIAKDELDGGTSVYTASMVVLKRNQKIKVKFDCSEESKKCSFPDTPPRNPDIFEKTELGIYIDNIIILGNLLEGSSYFSEVDDFNSLFKYVGSESVAAIRVDSSKTREALQRFGVPSGINIGNVTAKVSSDLEDISISLPLSILGYDKTTKLEIPVLENGKAIDWETYIHKTVESQLKTTFQPLIIEGLNSWFPNNAKGTTIGDITVKPDLQNISLDYSPSSRSISGSLPLKINDIAQTFTFKLSKRGLRFDRFSIDKQLRKSISDKLEAHLKSILPTSLAQYVETVQPYFDDGRLGFDIDLTARPLNCKLTKRVSIEYPFSDVDEQLEGLINDWKTPLEDCAVNLVVDEFLSAAPDLVNGVSLDFLGVQATLSLVQGGNPNCSSGYLSATLKADLGDGFVLDASQVCLKRDINGRIKFDWSSASLNDDKIIEWINFKMGGSLDSLRDYVDIDKLKPEKDGLSFEMVLVDLPYIGDLNLGRINLSSLSLDQILDSIKATIKPAITKTLNNELSSASIFEDIGFIKDIEPRVDISDSFKLSLSGKIQFYEEIQAGVTIPIIPIGSPIFEEPDTDILLTTISKYIPLKAGPLVLENPKIEKIGTEYGLVTGAKIDLSFAKLEIERVAITQENIELPEIITLAIGTPLEFGYIAVNNPGISYYTRGGLELVGDVTILNSQLSHVAKISSVLDLRKFPSAFTLKGDLIVADSIKLMNTKGEINFEESFIRFQSRSSANLRKILDINAEGELDGKAELIRSEADLSVLGLDIASSSFLLDFKREKLLFNQRQRILIGMADIGVATTPKLENPQLDAGIKLDLGGWGDDVLSGKLKASLKYASLRLKFIGIKVTIITPTVDMLNPGMIIDILKDLLKVDISDLFENLDLDDITISLMDSNGSIETYDSMSGKDGSTGEPSNDGSEQGNFNALPLEKDTDQSLTTPTWGDSPGSYFCRKVGKGRFDISLLRPGQSVRSRNLNYESLWHRSFGKETRDKICDSSSIMKDFDFVFAKRQIYNQQCNLDTGLVYSALKRFSDDEKINVARQNLFCSRAESQSSCSVHKKSTKVLTKYPINSTSPPDDLSIWNQANSMNSFAIPLGCKVTAEYIERKKCTFTSRICVKAHRFFGGRNSLIIHQQSTLLYKHQTNKFYAVNSCRNSQKLNQVGIVFPPSMIKVCASEKGLLELGSLNRSFSPGQRVEISIEEEVQLLNRITRDKLNLESAPGYSPIESFEFTLGMQGFKASKTNRLDEPQTDLYLVTNLKSGISRDFSISDESILDLMKNSGFRNEVLALFHQTGPIDLLFKGEKSLVFIAKKKTRSLSRKETYWLKKGTLPRRLSINDLFPYTESEYSQEELINVLTETELWISNNMGFSSFGIGLDIDQSIETQLLYNKEDFIVRVKKAKEVNPEVDSAPPNIRVIRGKNKNLKDCLLTSGALPETTVETALLFSKPVFPSKSDFPYILQFMELEKCR